MIDYIIADEWKLIEEGWDPSRVTQSESLFSLGNGRMGGRANFEEHYSGETFQGNYVAGIYYPDKTRVGWWKNGYPEYFAKVLNAADWMGMHVKVDDVELDLHTAQVGNFRRELNMKEGTYTRSFEAALSNGIQVRVESLRFLSMVDDQTGAVRYRITPINRDCTIEITSYVDFDVVNEDSNYDEKFWEEVDMDVAGNQIYNVARTKKLDFHVCSAMRWQMYVGEEKVKPKSAIERRDKYASNRFSVDVKAGQTATYVQFGCNITSENYPKGQLITWARETLSTVRNKGFDRMHQEQIEAWAKRWEQGDIRIDGDVKAQQAIRFNIFMLNQTYTGEDDRLNIGPKGFTGEKYGGATYWDTEAYCIPFYLSTAEQKVARQLLVYRYKQLDKAIENAEKLGFKNGAALYPMVTMNGEECHNEWEITFEEIHRNGAIAYAIKRYIDYHQDFGYLAEYGLPVLVGIARFWAQRVNWSDDKQKYVMLGVTGPNEYENNINNNWYTNYIASWCLSYASEAILYVQEKHPSQFQKWAKKLALNELEEIKQWSHICDHMYYPYSEKHDIFLQQDGFLDKEQLMVADIPTDERPINQHWSWDRILRSVFIKQADVLQGMYFFEDDFDEEALRRNYDFYEPRTVHESSLSPCVHSIIAAKLGDIERAYRFYLQTARLDLDDYNAEVHEGLHITSMAGTWMSIVEGFGGLRVRKGRLALNPQLPEHWDAYAFKIQFNGSTLEVQVKKDAVVLRNHGSNPLSLSILNEDETLDANEEKTIRHTA